MEKFNAVREAIGLGELDERSESPLRLQSHKLASRLHGMPAKQKSRAAAEVHYDVTRAHGPLDGVRVGGESQAVGGHVAEFIE